MTRRENHDSASFRFGGGIVLAVSLVPKTAISAAAQIADMADQVVAVKNVTAKEDEVEGEVVNISQQTLRDVQL